MEELQRKSTYLLIFEKKAILTHYSKSQIFAQKFNFDQKPTFARVCHSNIFFDHFSREIKVVNS